MEENPIIIREKVIVKVVNVPLLQVFKGETLIDPDAFAVEETSGQTDGNILERRSYELSEAECPQCGSKNIRIIINPFNEYLNCLKCNYEGVKLNESNPVYQSWIKENDDKK